MPKKLHKDELVVPSDFKTEFLAAMSHELRTPLNSIIGYSEMMEESAHAEGLDNYALNLQKVILSGRHLLKLINDLLDSMKIEAGKLDLYLTDASVKALMNELKILLEPLLAQNENTFELQIKTDKDKLHTDVHRLRQSIFCILENANKFTQKGHITLEVTSPDSVFEFSVTDTGTGIAPSDMEKIFKRFSQGDSSITRKYSGIGLGLYLAKSFCGLLGGDIQVRSREGIGSTFTVTVPQHSQVVREEKRSSADSEFEDKTALVIGFDESTLNDVVRDIKNMGFKVTPMRNGREALRLARATPPNLIVMDIANSLSLGDTLMEQWLILSELKSDTALSRIPLVVTAEDLSHESFGFVLGEVDFMTKPINIHTMIEKVKELVPQGVPTILVVDDDASARDIMSAAARKVGWKAIEAKNGREALDKMKKTLPSVILLDLMMPEMDGFSMISALQQNEKWANIPVVIVSAKELSADERMMLKKYSRGILQKGAYSRQELVDAICEQVK